MAKFFPQAFFAALTLGCTVGAYASDIPAEFKSVSVTPGQGEIPGLSVIKLEFNDFADVDVSNPGDVVLYKDGTEYKTLTSSNVDNAYEDYEEVIAFIFDPEIKEAGNYRLTIPAGALNLIEKGTFKNFPNSEAINLEWEIVGAVSYDIVPTRIKPAEGVIDLSAIQFENVILTVPSSDIRPREGATATLESIDGNYKKSAPIKYNFGTQLIMFFDTPTTNGKYKLTISEGSFGTPIWITNNEIGNANPEIVVNYTITGGREDNNVTYDLAPSSITPKPGSSLKSIKEFTLTFDTDVDMVADASATLAIGFGRYFQTAKFEKVDSKTFKVTFNPIPTEEGDYTLTINEGTFFDSVHAADNNEGRMNAELTYSYSMGALIDITSTVPADESILDSMGIGYQITINTNNNSMVKRMEFEMTSTEEGSSDEVTVISGESEKKNSNGAIYWEVTEQPIVLLKDHTYTIYYTLYNASGDAIKMSMITVVGDGKEIETVDILSTVPANDSVLDEMEIGYQITINTSDNSVVNRMEFEMTTTEDESTKAETVVRGESDKKNSNGEIYWEVSGEPILLFKNHSYTITYTLYDAEDYIIKTDAITFGGNSDSVGIIIVNDSNDTEYIYNLMGLRLGKDRNTLPAGVYIINGEKVVIRK